MLNVKVKCFSTRFEVKATHRKCPKLITVKLACKILSKLLASAVFLHQPRESFGIAESAKIKCNHGLL